ncbi:MAG: hypothetical protein DI547_00125 [Sphingobium sp.]|jgi:hypothetical protein|nr:MAG: hypothetical protein DI547_00125 [Sphingobium sp.]
MRKSLVLRGYLAIFLASSALVMPSVASAQQSPPACTAPAPALPESLSGWTKAQPMPAAASVDLLGASALTPGKAIDATLMQTPDVKYVVLPEKPGGTVSYGGMYLFKVETAGTYRVALGSGAWIDVLKGGQAMTSVAHGHGPDCSGIRKMVDFALQPGAYTLQVAANGAPSVRLMVSRLP